ncbi:hypothetical protein [Nitrosomonas communis]|uniref:Uncharacterized protein n=1 Tax=Nitrosomonas communis TaxID=44574 RepID=A0A1I4RNR1_9PROT|nr:hypothetical protein [Nitrosomonas communis]SFM53882.1 hypothetical protein SAMN05421863_103418 [Nitrosomonas communis]
MNFEIKKILNMPFNLQKRSRYPWLFGAAVVVSFTCFYALLPEHFQSPQLLLSILGSIAAFFHFLYFQHNTNTERFIVLFKDFNSRYDKLNDDLNRIAKKSNCFKLSQKEIQILYDYFNLCAEEHLFYKAGYIDENVWEAWSAGMKYFLCSPRIANLWAKEIKRGSYYKFSLDNL